MKKIITLLLIASIAKGQRMNDDSKHFYAGFGITLTTHFITSQFNVKPVKSRALGFLAGMTANFLKEFVWDKRLDRGVYSNEDLAFTSYGVVLGTGVSFCIDDNKKSKLRQLDTINFVNLNQKL